MTARSSRWLGSSKKSAGSQPCSAPRPSEWNEGTSHRDEIVELVRKHHRDSVQDVFLPGETQVLSSGAVLDESDRVALVEAALELRIAAGPRARRFESEFAHL